MNRITLSPIRRVYWSSLILIGVILLSTALYFQYVLESLPCMMCIHMRLWVVALILVGIFGLLTCHHKALRLISQLAALGVGVGMMERAYMLLGTERGFVFADCGFSLGLPEWFALDQWWPALFRIETACSTTPEVMFGITMAELLMFISVSLTLLLSTFLVSDLLRHRVNK